MNILEPPEPCHLPFGKVTSVLLENIDKLIKRACEVKADALKAEKSIKTAGSVSAKLDAADGKTSTAISRLVRATALST